MRHYKIVQLSDTTNLQGIFEEIDFYAQTDSTTYPATHKIRNLNNRYREVLTHIFEVYGGWQFNDSNSANDTLYADQTVTSDTAAYALPATAIRIVGVELKTNGSSSFTELYSVTNAELKERGSIAEANRTTGVPTQYKLGGDTIELYPTPNFTQATSLRVYFDGDISVFAVTDTTVVPGFAAPFHRALSLGGALDWVIASADGTPKSTTKFAWLTDMFAREIKSIRKFYASRWQDKTPRIRVSDEPFN